MLLSNAFPYVIGKRSAPKRFDTHPSGSLTRLSVDARVATAGLDATPEPGNAVSDGTTSSAKVSSDTSAIRPP